MVKQQVTTWHNWSGSVQANPQQFSQPHDLAELITLVGRCGREGRHIRVVGSGHSFTPLVQTDDILLSLDKLEGIESIDREQGRVTVQAGTKLKTLGAELLKQGLAQENLGDIDVQSIAGAISTGTHGTGTCFGTLSTQVVGLTLVTADGQVLECSAEQNAEIFKAAQVSVGVLGVIVRVTLRVVPAKRLHFKSRREQIDDCLSSLERYKQENSHFEFYWLPYTEMVQTKFLNETEAEPTIGNLWGTFNKIVIENGLYWLLSEGCRLMPALTKTISKLSAQGIATVEEVDYSHRLYATPRAVRFQEMEYNIPVQHFSNVFREIQECIRAQQFAVHFPIECRFVRADDIWLSPAYQRDSAYIAIHMYKGMAYKDYFQQIEAIFQRYEGRPHWGKMHNQTSTSLTKLYPQWHEFRRIRAHLDPQGIFLNTYLQRIFDTNGQIPDSAENQSEKIDTQLIDNR